VKIFLLFGRAKNVSGSQKDISLNCWFKATPGITTQPRHVLRAIIRGSNHSCRGS